jgi:hypothetical protein
MSNVTVPPKTPEEIEEFLELPDITVNPSKSAQAFKTNLLLFDGNFTGIVVFLNNLTSFVKYFYTLIDLSAIVQQVIDALGSSKDTIPILTTSNIGTFTLTNIGQNIYKLMRTDAYTLVLTRTNQPTWDTSKLMCQVKQIDGTFVYPVIRTANNNVTISFADAIATNYNIYLL